MNQHSTYPFSRRAFLAASAAALLAPLPSLAAYPDRFHADGGLVILPTKGTVVIAADFHTRFAEFERFLTASRLVERLKDEDVYGVLLGDVVDIKNGDPLAERDGDVRILDRITKIKTDLGERGERLILLRGNHEHESAYVYGVLKEKYGMTTQTQQRWVAALYASENGAYFTQFNCLERITEAHYQQIRDLPLAVLAKNGVICTHASPPPPETSVADLVAKKPEVIKRLVWDRPDVATPDGFTAEDVAGFLQKMEGGTLMITGHTPVLALPENIVRDGLAVCSPRQVVLGTSYGSAKGQKRYIELDLSKKYDGAAAIRSKQELLHMPEPTASADWPAHAAMAMR